MIRVFATSNMNYTPFKGFHEIDLMFLKENEIEMVNDVSHADVIVSQHFKQLKPYYLKYFNTKKYLIWTLEPRFNTHESSLKLFYMGLMKVHVMNIYTGDVFAHPLSFHVEKINKELSNLNNDFVLSNRKLVGLMSYYRGLETEPVKFKGEDVDLIKKRVEIAFYGHKKGLMDIYGKGWPYDMSKEDSRDGDWVASKGNLLEDYHFNLCFENTVAPRYVTEKIWDSIANYCLPIYYGKGTEIYNLFPQNSFIDYSEMKNPEELFDFIQEIDNKTYVHRLNICINIYNSISNYTKHEKIERRKKSLKAIVEKLKQITN